MPKGKFVFTYIDENTERISEFEVNEKADMNTVIEAFAEFLKLTGFVYDPEEDN